MHKRLGIYQKTYSGFSGFELYFLCKISIEMYLRHFLFFLSSPTKWNAHHSLINSIQSTVELWIVEQLEYCPTLRLFRILMRLNCAYMFAGDELSAVKHSVFFFLPTETYLTLIALMRVDILHLLSTYVLILRTLIAGSNVLLWRVGACVLVARGKHNNVVVTPSSSCQRGSLQIRKADRVRQPRGLCRSTETTQCTRSDIWDLRCQY